MTTSQEKATIKDSGRLSPTRRDDASPAPVKAQERHQNARPPWLRGADMQVIEAAIEQPRAKQSDVESGQEKEPVPPPDDWRPKGGVKPLRCRGCRALCSAYRNLLRLKPLRASCLTAMVIMCLGDMGAQLIEGRHSFHQMDRARGRAAAVTLGLDFAPDARRTAVMAGYSAAVFTPIYFGLYTLMERLCATGQTLSVARHSLFVLAAGAPGDAILLVVAPYAEQFVLGKPATVAEADALSSAKLRRDVPRLMQSTLCFWGSFNVLNFWLMPPTVHLLTSSIASVCWNTYLSYVAHEHLHARPVEHELRGDRTADQQEIRRRLPRGSLSSIAARQRLVGTASRGRLGGIGIADTSESLALPDELAGGRQRDETALKARAAADRAVRPRNGRFIADSTARQYRLRGLPLGSESTSTQSDQTSIGILPQARLLEADDGATDVPAGASVARAAVLEDDIEDDGVADEIPIRSR
eukprot:CAMPEP_0119325320 /NCGR_PEP_ID=MMETSP1333-20130426/65508_1 /TAXON_ID=418940 /ORGANISM="Scyphosphaera apsteinii, Strain RCC1455" /LENGTH=469 /DNA_ID=CAMNT_0007333281 /DNA_START=109 /DNA_END=1518 /DNA_ORIENTATION=+